MFGILLNYIRGMKDRLFWSVDREQIEEVYERRNESMIQIISADSNKNEELEVIDGTRNIIICTKEDEHIIRTNNDGTFDLIANQNYSLSGKRIFGDNVLFDYRPKLKMSIPKGIKLDFECPYDNQVVTHIYKNFDKIQTGLNAIDDVTIYNRMHFDIYVDSTRFVQCNKTFSFPLGCSILTFYFAYILIGEQTNFENKIYWIKNNEAFENFKEYYSK